MTIYIKLALEMSDKDGMEKKWFGNNWVFFEKSKKLDSLLIPLGKNKFQMD